MEGYLQRKDARKLATLGTITRVFLGIYVLVWGFVTGIAAWMLQTVLSSPYSEAMFMVAALQGMVTLLGMAVFAVCCIAFLLWFHKAIANLHDAGLSGLKARPGWSVASFFVPFVQLYAPYIAMRELWNRSHGEDEWQSDAAVSDISIWWTCLLAGTGLTFFVFFIALWNVLTNVNVVTPPGVNEALSLAGVALWCVSAFFLFRIVRTITQAQQTFFDEVAAFA